MATARFLFFYLCCIALQAQEEWSLQKCIRQALAENLNIRLSEANVRAAEIDLTASKWLRSPNLSANLNSGVSIGTNINPATNTLITQDILFGNTGLTGSATIWQGGQISQTIRQNRKTLAAGENDLRQAQNDLALLVANQYLTVLLSEERKFIAESNLRTTVNNLEQINKLFSAGSRPEADVLEGRAQLARAEQSLIQADNALELAWLALKQSLRMPPDAPMRLERLTEDQFTRLSGSAYTVDDLVAYSRENMPSMKAASLRLDAARVGEKIARSAYYPRVFAAFGLSTRYSDAAIQPTSFGLGIDTIPARIDGQAVLIEAFTPKITGTEVIPLKTQLDRFLGYSFSVGLNVPLFNQMQTRANVGRAKLQTLRSQISLDQQADRIRQDITQAMTQVRAARKEYDASLKSRDLAKLSYDMTRRRFDLGATSLFDLNQSQLNLQVAENNLIIARYDLVFKTQVLEFYAGKEIKL
jgi:outer membrane protein